MTRGFMTSSLSTALGAGKLWLGGGEFWAQLSPQRQETRYTGSPASSASIHLSQTGSMSAGDTGPA